MKKLLYYYGLALVVSGLVLVYCEKKPEKELQDAQNALKELEEIGAPQYAPDEWQSLKSKFDDAQVKVERRKYKEAREILASVVSAAPAVKQKVEEKKVEEQKKAQEQQQAPQEVTSPEGATAPAPQQPGQ